MILRHLFFFFFFFNDTATTEIYTLSLHDALPISALQRGVARVTRRATRQTEHRQRNEHMASHRHLCLPERGPSFLWRVVGAPASHARSAYPPKPGTAGGAAAQPRFFRVFRRFNLLLRGAGCRPVAGTGAFRARRSVKPVSARSRRRPLGRLSFLPDRSFHRPDRRG